MTRITLEFKDKSIIQVILKDYIVEEIQNDRKILKSLNKYARIIKTEVNCSFCELPCGNVWCGDK